MNKPGTKSWANEQVGDFNILVGLCSFVPRTGLRSRFYIFFLQVKKKILGTSAFFFPKAVLDRYAFQSQWPVALPMGVV